MTTDTAKNDYIVNLAQRARKAAFVLGQAGYAARTAALTRVCAELSARRDAIFAANASDVARARQANRSDSFIDRLTVNDKTLASITRGVAEIASSADPLGEVVAGATLKSGIKMIKKRVPLGVVAIIYEARPNVTVDAAALCIMSGNAVILKGSSDALASNIAIGEAIRAGLAASGLPADCAIVIEDISHDAGRELMRANGLIDVLIPRGGSALIKATVENATVPVIETSAGNCHIFVDESADINMAADIVVNAKLSRPSVCNAAETLLVHKKIAARFLPVICEKLSSAGCQLRGDEFSRSCYPYMNEAQEADWETEYLDKILAVKAVASLDEATEHINRYSTHHSEAIITNDYANAKRFEELVDSAAVYVNASTRFTDGGEFSMGAEIGISTQKLHARGPMGLEALTTVKYILEGNGQIRG